jgi:hypothetical protein
VSTRSARETVAAMIAIAALVVGAAFAVLLPSAPAHAGSGGQGGTGSGGGPVGIARILQDGSDNVIDVVGNGGTSKIDVATGSTLFLLGPSLGGIGATANRTIGQTAAGFYDNAGLNNLFTVDGVGITTMVTGVTAANNLAGTAACSAAGNVGETVLYSDTSTSKISFCSCEQTGAGTFAWGATTATGDCT